ncbi:hypothetical protein [Thermoactinospora rubra]|uniref:hypothetical protein n=1 Tax=Thermoactinospora rubra TaxID=1088767 RepID=UPI000A11188D|nr:hypothetical protein [Thermoactinospora rubra]
MRGRDATWREARACGIGGRRRRAVVQQAYDARPETPPLTATDEKTITLDDGGTIAVTAYSNGEIEIRVSEAPFVIAALDGGEEGGDAIIRLSPGRQGGNVRGTWYRDRMAKINDRDKPTG